MRDRLGRPRARPAAAPDRAVRRRPPPEAGRGVPRRAAGAPGRHLQGALQRHRLPLPHRHRPHLLLRQPDQRRRAGDRGRRVRPLRAAALGARHRRVLPRPAVRRALGRPPPLAEGDLRLARPRGAPHRRARRRPRHVRQDPRAPRCLRGRRPAGRRRRRPRHRLRPRRLRAAAGQGRVGGRRAPDGLRHHHARLRGLPSREWDRVARVRRALDRGHVLPPGPRDGQRHRLRLDRRRRLARHDAALDRQHRPDRPRASWCCSTWASRATTSTPPTSPAPCRSTARSPRCSATSTTSCTPPSRRASTP